MNKIESSFSKLEISSDFQCLNFTIQFPTSSYILFQTPKRVLQFQKKLTLLKFEIVIEMTTIISISLPVFINPDLCRFEKVREDFNCHFSS